MQDIFTLFLVWKIIAEANVTLRYICILFGKEIYLSSRILDSETIWYWILFFDINVNSIRIPQQKKRVLAALSFLWLLQAIDSIRYYINTSTTRSQQIIAKFLGIIEYNLKKKTRWSILNYHMITNEILYIKKI